jgi:hypothetical protein
LVSYARFHRDYIPPRKYNAPHVKEPTNAKYPLTTTLVPHGLSTKGFMLDKMAALKFVDHDIIDEQNFPELARDNYFCIRSVPGTREILLETKRWEIGLKKLGIMNLLEVPLFEHSLEINSYIKLLLRYIHGGTFFLDPPVSIDTALIAQIIGILKVGKDSTLLFKNIGERALSESMMEKFHTFRGKGDWMS